MKVRNGGRWTREERIQLWHHLRQVASLSPYLIVLLTPGSMVLLQSSRGGSIAAACSAHWHEGTAHLKHHLFTEQTPFSSVAYLSGLA